MKTKLTWLAVAAVLALGTLWAARATSRAHRQIVTLDVREMPLNDVLKRVQHQTRQTIRAEKALDARITLHVKNKPLPEVLDRIAAQAGACWTSLYAVYQSKQHLSALDAALRNDGKYESAGWVKLAPTTPDFLPPGPDAAPPPEAGINGPMPGAPGPHGRMIFRASPDGPVMFSGGPDGKREVWSPQELVVEEGLKPKVPDLNIQRASREEAADLARKTGAKWTTLLAFHKTSSGLAFSRMAHGRPGNPMHQPNEKFSALTPSQRVQRARERELFHSKSIGN